MKPTIGRIVHYVLRDSDAEQINRRRTTGAAEGGPDKPGTWFWPPRE